MNRTLVLGIAILLAVVGLALMGGEKQAVAGHGCHGGGGHGCHGVSDCHGGGAVDACNGRSRCHGLFSGRRKGCHGRRNRCHGAAPACCGAVVQPGCHGGAVPYGAPYDGGAGPGSDAPAPPAEGEAAPAPPQA